MTTPLGRLVPYSETIDESVLFPIERGQARTRIGIREPLPFEGVDRWRCVELSWLDAGGIPEVGIGMIEYSAASTMIVESKSLKLFLGSLNFTKFSSVQEVERVVRQALVNKLGTDSVKVSIKSPLEWGELKGVAAPGVCVDRVSIE